MNKSNIARIAILCGCFVAMLSANMQADSTFTVSSYIPQRFVDFRWRLDGHIGAQGFRNDNHSKDDFVDATVSSSLDEQSLSFTSGSEYRYRTIPRYLTWTVKGGFGFDHTRYQSTNRTSVSPRLTKTIEAGKYLASDFFVAAIFATGWSYTQNSGTRMIGLYDDGASAAGPMEASASAVGDGPEGDDKNYNISVALLPGWGRMYEGQFAATALYMIGELKRDGILKGEPTYQEMSELTEIIYQFRLKHAVDSRLHKIEALSSVMTFLAEKGLTDDLGPHGYLLVQDVWDYFPRFDRRFGWQVKGGPGFDYGYSSLQDNYGYPETGVFSYRHWTTENRSPYLLLQADYCRPMGLRWQLDLSTSFRYYLDPSIIEKYMVIDYPSGLVTSDRLEQNRWAYYTIALEGTARYIFDSRTSALFQPSYRLTHARFSNVDEMVRSWEIRDRHETRGDSFGGQLILAGSLEYRISVPTTLRVGVRYTRRDDDTQWTSFESRREVDNSSYTLSADIVHYLY